MEALVEDENDMDKGLADIVKNHKRKHDDDDDNMIKILQLDQTRVISTIPAREIDEFIKSGVDDLVLIPKESEVTSDSNLKCSMPLDSSPSRRLDVLGESKVDIHLPFGEHLDTLSIRDREIDFNPRDIETNDLIPGLRMFDVPLDSKEFMDMFMRIGFGSAIKLVFFDESQVVTYNRKFVCGFSNGDCGTKSRCDNTVGSPHGFIIHWIVISKNMKKVTKVIDVENGRVDNSRVLR
nr:hypothetical protein [Tanacetum cinerariifolium]